MNSRLVADACPSYISALLHRYISTFELHPLFRQFNLYDFISYCHDTTICTLALTRSQIACHLSAAPRCEQVCGKQLNCGVHECEAICHSGVCQPCSVTIQRRKYGCTCLPWSVIVTAAHFNRVQCLCSGPCQSCCVTEQWKVSFYYN